MSKQRVSATIASAQDVGGANDGIQRERVRAGMVQTADGSRVVLSVVAVGSRSGDSAARVIEQVFQAVSGSQADNLAVALKRSLEISSQSLARQGAEVGASAVAMRRNTAFFASVGDNAIFRIAGQEAIRLTQPSSSRLGTVDAPRIQSGPESGIAMQRGDRVVVVSAGLLEPSSGDGKPYVDPNAVPGHIKNLPPEDAAKHLVSIALGRDVASNVSVAVVGEAKETRRVPAAALIAIGAFAAVLLVIGALTLIGPSDNTDTTDFGFAVLVRGGVLADTGDGVPALVGNLDPIPVDTALTAQTDATLGMQSTFEGSTDLARSTVYLVQGTDIRLSEIDPRGSEGASGRSHLELDEGSILVSRQSGTWEFRIQAITEEAILIGAGPAAMGVGMQFGSLQLDCLIGVCRYESPSGEEILLSSGDRILVGASSGIVQESSIPLESVAQWSELCSGCIPDS
jgi:hypothetical protein